MADLYLAGRAQLRGDHGAAVAGSTLGLDRAGHGRPAAQGQGQGRAPAGRDPVAWNQTRNPGSDPSGMGRSSPHAPSDDHRRGHRCIHLRGRARRPPGIYGRWKRLVADSTGCGDRYPAVCPTGDDAAGRPGFIGCRGGHRPDLRDDDRWGRGLATGNLDVGGSVQTETVPPS